MDGASIFAAFAGNFDRSALDVLERFVSGAPKEHVEVVAHILRGGKNVPFDDVGFVTRMLRIANKHGAEHMQYVASSLHAAVSSGVRSGAIGQPFAEDVEQGRRAAEVARTLPVGSLEARFYQSLADAAARNIEWHTDHDQKMLDGREWS